MPVYGEPQASDVMRVKLKDTFDWKCTIPELYATAEFDLGEVALTQLKAFQEAEHNDKNHLPK